MHYAFTPCRPIIDMLPIHFVHPPVQTTNTEEYRIMANGKLYALASAQTKRFIAFLIKSAEKLIDGSVNHRRTRLVTRATAVVIKLTKATASAPCMQLSGRINYMAVIATLCHCTFILFLSHCRTDKIRIVTWKLNTSCAGGGKTVYTQNGGSKKTDKRLH